MIIDSHLHVWNLDRARYPWLGPEAGDLHRTHDLAEIAPVLSEVGVGGVILVQAADGADDTEWMLETARDHPLVRGVVAWSPLDDPHRMARDLDRFASGPVVGIRNLVHERPRSWLMRAELEASLDLLAERGLPLDVPTVDHHALADIATLAERHPDLVIVIDHLGKPPVGGSPEAADHWRELIGRCAAHPSVVAKVSGLYAAHGPLAGWTTDDVRPFVEHAVAVFGADRLMYGGDWPIADLAGGYSRTWQALSSILEVVSTEERAAILGGTAESVYALERSQ